MAAARKRAAGPAKVTDEAAVIQCAAGPGVIREETWEDAQGNLIRYNLAFINFHLCAKDNGRVLGYDTAHGRLHRHFAGKVEVIDPAPYDEVFERFLSEVDELKRRRKL
jgi:hypothetical protein